MKKNILLLWLFFGLAGNAFAQEQYAKLNQWLENNVDEMGGRAILMVYQDGKIVYNHAVNRMNNRQKMLGKLIASRQGKTADFSDFTANSKLPIASCGKWLSAALVMTFVDEGKLKLTDSVGRFLPVLSKNGKGAITIQECLSHTTGILSPDLRENLKEMRAIKSMDEAIEQIAQYPIEGQAGKVFRYSNTGLQIAGAVIEKISGKSFETLFAERIAIPLGMKNTDFGKAKVALPAGGANSTPNDYMNFLMMILNKGQFHGKQILSEKSIAEMQVNRITAEVKVAHSPAEAGGLGYGFGEWIMTNGAISSPGLFGSFPWINNDKKYCAFLMTFYLKSDRRQEKYVELRKLVEASI
ncbi:serine hydrolase domain-containing protein [Arcicella lustrica]|uniref:Serine hydrolase domain-containing protein n=1 Tax=Arcicella lustrica TaxID=2984196 RepID=A0ABU5SG83_9BACT|nr:serine hydrolase domain-containing protein [Arcicella sp. DC25W]MEA5426197.1 serine hydrolase domain-containing protein [Arcicella sp. DC25W]